MACKKTSLHPRDNEKRLLPHKVQITQHAHARQIVEIGEWLASDEANGRFFAFNTLWEMWAIRFDDADTAFAFKMRFG